MLRADQTTGQMQEGFVGKSELLPAYQQASRAIEPRVQALDHPTPRKLGGLQVAADLLLWLQCWCGLRPVVQIGTNMGFILMRLHNLIDGIVIIASVQAQMLWLLFGRRRARTYNAIQGGLDQLHVSAI